MNNQSNTIRTLWLPVLLWLFVELLSSCKEKDPRIRPSAPTSPPSDAGARRDTPKQGYTSVVDMRDACALAKSVSVRDKVAAWSPYFRVERRGILYRIQRHPDQLEAIKEALSELNSAGMVFVPCQKEILFWLPDNSQDFCSGPEKDWLEDRVGPIEVLHCFDYVAPDIPADCLSGRLPRKRCLEYYSPVFREEGCGAGTLTERKERNQLAIKLGYAPPGSPICLGTAD